MSKPGPICYVEIGATDVPRTSKFYNSVFDWQITDMNTQVYTTFATGDGIGGGLYKTTQIKPGGGILIYIAVDDIESSLKKISASGGKTITPKSDIPQTGWYAHFADPEGNHLGLFTPLSK